MQNKCKKILNWTFNNLFLICCIIFMILAKYVSWYYIKNHDIYNYDKLPIVATIVFAIIYLITMVRKKEKITIYDILLYIVIALSILSTIFAIDKDIALWGNIRGNGLFVLLSYYTLALNIIHEHNRKKQKIIIGFLLFIGIIEMVYAYLQLFTNVTFVHRYIKLHMANALSLNPNFFGHFLTLLIPISISGYLFANKKYKFILFTLSIIFTIGLVFAQSMMPILSTIVTLFLLFIYLLFTNRKKLLQYLLITVICTATFMYTNRTTMNYYITNEYYLERYYTIDGGFNDLKKFFISFFKIEQPVVEPVEEIQPEQWEELPNAKLDSGRIWIWKNSLHILKEYPLLGCGPDNFRQAFGDIDPGIIYLEAHNVYLNYAINVGMPAAIIFIFSILFVFFKSLKAKDNFTLCILPGFVGYSICAFGGISVIPVTTYYMIVFGILANHTIKKNQK